MSRFWFTLLFSLTALLVAACQQQANPLLGGDAGPPLVTTALVEREALPFERGFRGRTVAADEVELLARVAGYLDAHVAADGSRVAEGALLYRIEQAGYRAELARAEGKLAQMRAQLANAEIDLKRQQALWEKQATTENV